MRVRREIEVREGSSLYLIKDIVELFLRVWDSNLGFFDSKSRVFVFIFIRGWDFRGVGLEFES